MKAFPLIWAYVLSRASELSTWLGLIAFIGAILHREWSPDQIHHMAGDAVALSGLIAAAFPDRLAAVQPGLSPVLSKLSPHEEPQMINVNKLDSFLTLLEAILASELPAGHVKQLATVAVAGARAAGDLVAQVQEANGAAAPAPVAAAA